MAESDFDVKFLGEADPGGSPSVISVSATFHLRKWLSSQEITPKNAAEKAEPTTIVA